MTNSSADRVVGLGQATVEQIGVGPRSSEAVVELETFSLQAGGAVGTTLATVVRAGRAGAATSAACRTTSSGR